MKFNIHILLKVLGYTQPNENGFCVVAGTSDHQGAKPENCKCSHVEIISKCQEMCQNDDKCDGYSFAKKYSKCYLYTTSPCGSNCYKKKQGVLGDIVQKSIESADESGCYIKKKGKNSIILDN